jgi:hypothetical protein
MSEVLAGPGLPQQFGSSGESGDGRAPMQEPIVAVRLVARQHSIAPIHLFAPGVGLRSKGTEDGPARDRAGSGLGASAVVGAGEGTGIAFRQEDAGAETLNVAARSREAQKTSATIAVIARGEVASEVGM